jgi:hypothetical protein
MERMKTIFPPTQKFISHGSGPYRKSLPRASLITSIRRFVVLIKSYPYSVRGLKPGG